MLIAIISALIIAACISAVVSPRLHDWAAGNIEIYHTLGGICVLPKRFGVPYGTMRIYQDGELSLEVEFKFGRRHGRVVKYNNGALVCVETYFMGDIYGPIKFYKRGQLRVVQVPGQFYQRWYSNGRPRLFYQQYGKTFMQTEWRADGTVRKVSYFKDSLLHCETGPASVHHRRDGSPRAKIWCERGRLHRTDGPAIEKYGRATESTILSTEYCAHGWRFTRAEFTARMYGEILNTIARELPMPIADEIVDNY